MNEYRTMYLKELIPIINQTAVSIMMQPQKTLLVEQASKEESLSQLNDRIAQFNDGVRSMAVYLVNVLEKEGEDDGA